jgi:hypothetical protein
MVATANGSVNFLRDVSLGKIHRWIDKKASSMTPISFPSKDGNLTEAYDDLGVIQYINFEGMWTGTFEYIQNNIYALKSIADGAQYVSVNLSSPFVCAIFGSGDVRVQGWQGVNTTATASKLIDSTANFQTTNQVIGDIVKNMVTGYTTTIASIDSETQLTLDDDIFPTSGGTGVSYAVTGTIHCKLLSIEANWETPGLSYCKYKISIIQTV